MTKREDFLVRIVPTVQNLAAPPRVQLEYLEQQGLHRALDELGLEFEDAWLPLEPLLEIPRDSVLLSHLRELNNLLDNVSWDLDRFEGAEWLAIRGFASRTAQLLEGALAKTHFYDRRTMADADLEACKRSLIAAMESAPVRADLERRVKEWSANQVGQVKRVELEAVNRLTPKSRYVAAREAKAYDDSQLRECARELGLTVVPQQVGERARAVLAKFPWKRAGFGIDRSEAKQISLWEDPVDASHTRLAHESTLYVYVNPKMSGLVGDALTIVDNLDLIFTGNPGYGYLFGANIRQEELILDPTFVAEYDDIQGIVFVVDAPMNWSSGSN